MINKVYFVGAGPGDAGLITVRGLGILRQADTVIYDYLLDTNEGKRAGILIEEAIGMRRKFLLSSSRITRSEERASGVKKILANPEDLEPVK